MYTRDPFDADRTYLTLGGVETYLHFLQGFPLPDMCGFRVLEDEHHYAQLEERFLFPIADAAAHHDHGLVVDALVWRASSDHVRQAGYGEADVARLNRLGVERARASMTAWQERRGIPKDRRRVLVGGDVGPRGDGYTAAGSEVTPLAAYNYHRPQLEALAEAGVDVVTAYTLTSVAEGIGIARAAAALDLPVVVSPTVETDGRLPDGTWVGDFIEGVDDATSGAPAFFMVNCAHPTHLGPVLEEAELRNASWLDRFRGFRGNASTRSHAELDESPTLDRGDAEDFARRVAEMQRRFGLRLVGGCCGTDTEHVIALAAHAAPQTVHA